MSTTTYPAVQSLPPSLSVRHRNRMVPKDFPLRLAGIEPPAIIKSDTIDASARRKLVDTIWDQLSYPTANGIDGRKQNELVEAYVASLTQLGQFRDDTLTLIRTVYETNPEFRQQSGTTDEQARDEAISAKLDELLAKYEIRIEMPANVLDANVVAKPIENLHSRLRSAIFEAVEGFVDQFFAELEKLVDVKCVGLIEWPGDNVCCYHFFKEVILQEGGGTTTSRGEVERTRGTNVGWRKVTEVTRGRHIHRHARHEHHVLDAFHTSISNSHVIMPPQVKRLVASIPEWLRNVVQVVDGTIFREKIVEQDYRDEKWQSIRVHEEPVYGCEPAVIIGSFVLTGWGPREVAAELQRREQEASVQHQDEEATSAVRHQAAWALASAATLPMGSVLTWQAFRHQPLWAFVSVAFSLYGIWAMSHVIASHRVARRLPVSVPRNVLYLSSVTLLVVAAHAILIALAIESWAPCIVPLILVPASLLPAFGWQKRNPNGCISSASWSCG